MALKKFQHHTLVDGVNSYPASSEPLLYSFLSPDRALTGTATIATRRRGPYGLEQAGGKWGESSCPEDGDHFGEDRDDTITAFSIHAINVLVWSTA